VYFERTIAFEPTEPNNVNGAARVKVYRVALGLEWSRGLDDYPKRLTVNVETKAG
jgi:hypothetical protein